MNEMQTLSKTAPLPSFLEVQWSRVCDPLLTYKPVACTKEMNEQEGGVLKFENPSTSRANMALLSPTLPSTIDQDLLLESHEGPMIPTSRGLLFQDDQPNELTTDIWHI